MSRVSIIGEKVLKQLINCYHAEQPYYLKQNIGYLFNNEDDNLFVTDEDVIEHVKKCLSDKYFLEVKEVERTFTGETENFTYPDIELKIVKTTDLKF